MNSTARCIVNGKAEYRAIVLHAGKQLLPVVFSDFFADDADAEKGLRAILEGQGYKVEAVRIGDITEIDVAK